jgi:hypothetical protein
MWEFQPGDLCEYCSDWEVKCKDGYTSEQYFAFFEKHEKRRKMVKGWASTEALRVVEIYPQLTGLFSNRGTYRQFLQLLIILRREGKTFEDIVVMPPNQRPANFKRILGDRV